MQPTTRELSKCPGCGSVRFYRHPANGGINATLEQLQSPRTTPVQWLMCLSCYAVWWPDGTKRVSSPGTEHVHEVSSETGFCSCGGKIELDKLGSAASRCTATREDGQPCKSWAIKGTTRCYFHPEGYEKNQMKGFKYSGYD